MPRQKTITLYQYSELNARAQERARDWFREASAGDTFWQENIVSEFQEILEACGYSLSMRRGTRSEPAIYWEINPDAAGFTASWSASRVNVAAMLSDRPATYTDSDGKVQQCKLNAKLRPILEAFAALAAANPDSYGDCDASGRGAQIRDTNWQREDCRDLNCTCGDTADAFRDLCGDLAGYLLAVVNAEWEWNNSDENVAETIAANEYEFTEDGERA